MRNIKILIIEKQTCCPANMTYAAKGSACPETCKYPQVNSHCPTKYVEGCQCRDGKVQNVDQNGNIECIESTQCNVCKVDGIIYTNGEKVFKKCQQW